MRTVSVICSHSVRHACSTREMDGLEGRWVEPSKMRWAGCGSEGGEQSECGKSDLWRIARSVVLEWWRRARIKKRNESDTARVLALDTGVWTGSARSKLNIESIQQCERAIARERREVKEG